MAENLATCLLPFLAVELLLVVVGTPLRLSVERSANFASVYGYRLLTFRNPG